MKGAIPVMMAVTLLIFTFVSLFMLTTIFVYRYRITLEINYEYDYNNVQLALLTLLSSTHDGKQVSEILADHISMNEPVDTTIIENKLDKLIDDGCYNLTVSNKFSVHGLNTECNKKYASIAKIPNPYNPDKLTGDVILVTG